MPSVTKYPRSRGRNKSKIVSSMGYDRRRKGKRTEKPVFGNRYFRCRFESDAFQPTFFLPPELLTLLSKNFHPFCVSIIGWLRALAWHCAEVAMKTRRVDRWKDRSIPLVFLTRPTPRGAFFLSKLSLWGIPPRLGPLSRPAFPVVISLGWYYSYLSARSKHRKGRNKLRWLRVL